MADTMTIADLRRRTGKPSSALRFYEREGLLDSIGRQGGMRVYRSTAVEQIALIDLLQATGFTLGEIRGILTPTGGFVADWREKAHEKLADLDRRLSEIESAKTILEHAVACPHPSLDECPVFRGWVGGHVATLGSGGHDPAG